MAENGTAGAVGYICDLGEFMSELETDEVDVSFYAQGSENPEINLTANELLEMCSVGYEYFPWWAIAGLTRLRRGNAVTVALRDYYDIILVSLDYRSGTKEALTDLYSVQSSGNSPYSRWSVTIYGSQY